MMRWMVPIGLFFAIVFNKQKRARDYVRGVLGYDSG